MPPLVAVPTKSIGSSWTIWFNLLSIVISTSGLLIDNWAQLGIPNDQILGWIVSVNAVGNIVLRLFKTTQPLGPAGTYVTVADRAVGLPPRG